jgi:hypothetical protein
MDADFGLGAYADVPSAVAAMSRSGGVVDPEPETRAIYEGLYERVYLRAYDRLLPLCREIAEVTGYPAAEEH